MTRTIITSLLFLLCTGLCATISADAAPPVYPGYSLWPFDTKDVRMKSQKVDIFYGDTTCKIEAVFQILNPTKGIEEKKIGFPRNISETSPWSWNPKDTVIKIYDFTMSLNGVKQAVTDAPRSRDIQSNKHYWYGWTCKLKPGLNIVKLTYHTVASYGNSGYRWEKTLYYDLNSEKNWPGQIDTVQVTMHFSEGIAKRQILVGTSPLGYKINEKEITWRFTSFTPTAENNIALHLIDFKFFANILKYEKVLSAPNADNETKLNAAKFFATLAPSKGMNVRAPTDFSRSYFDENVLPNLKPTEKALFASTYKLHKNLGYEDSYYTDDYENFRKNDALQHTVLEVMNRIGYFEKIVYPVIYKYIEGAKRLFREVVTSDPKNVTAWKAYIENYYLIETGACGPCLYGVGAGCDCPESQKELIKEAFRNCGNDSTIAIWNNYLFPTRSPLPSILELERYTQPQENVTIRLKHYSGGYSTITLSAGDYNLVKKVYKKANDSLLVLNSTQVDDVAQKKVIEILGGCNLYRNNFCRELRKLRKGGK